MAHSLQRKLAKKYMDWAEVLPRFQGGTIRRLQEIRRRQRTHAKECFEESRPPEGTLLNYQALILTEVFSLEQTQALRKGLQKLFPSGGRSLEVLETISKNANNLSSIGWYRLGIVSRSSRLFGTDFRIDPGLPDIVRYVDLSLYGVLPSTFVVALEFVLEDKVTQELRDLQARHYLPDVEFYRWIPRGPMAGGYSENAAAAVKQRELLRYCEFIRKCCMRWSSTYLQGHFLLPVVKQAMPSFDIFEIKISHPDAETDVIQSIDIEWIRSNRNWLNSIGIGAHAPDMFRQENYWFFSGNSGREGQEVPSRLVVINHAENSDHEFIVKSLVPAVSLSGYLNDLKKIVEAKRYLSDQNKRFLFAWAGGRYLEQSLALKRLLILLDRLKFELKDNRTWVSHLMESLNSFFPADCRYGKDSLSFVFLRHLDWQMQRIRKHLVLAEQNSVDLTVWLMFVLQKRMMWLTIIATIATVVATLTTTVQVFPWLPETIIQWWVDK